MESTGKHARPRSRGRKLRRGLLLLSLAAVVVAIVVQVILWSDLPRRFVVARLERDLGAHVQLGALEVGWLGRTTAREVSVRRPLDDGPLLLASRVEVTHAALLRVLLGGGLAIEAVSVEQPRIRVVEDERGVWNVIEAFAQRGRPNGAANGADGARRAAPLALPRLAITDAEVVLAPHGRPPVTLSGVRLTGAPEGSVAWTFAGAIGDMLEFEGRLALDTSMAQHVEFSGDGLEALLGPLGVGDGMAAVGMRATWDGARTDAGVAGRLAVTRARVGDAHASGSLDVSLERGAVRLDGPDLVVDVPARGIADLRVRAGAVVVTGDRLEATRVVVETDRIRAMVDGHWDADARDGAATATWETARPLWSADAHGRLDVSVAAPSVGPMFLTAAVQAAGRRADASFELNAEVSASGPDVRTLAGAVTINTARWREGDRTIAVADVRAGLAADWPMIRLDTIEGPEVDAAVRAAYDAASGQWSIVGSIRDYPVVAGDETVPVSLTIDARGDHERADVERLTASTPYGTARVEGRVNVAAGLALDATIDAAGSLAALPEGTPSGTVRVRGRVQGPLFPPAARFSGTVETPELALTDAKIPAITWPVALTIDERYDVRWTTDAVKFAGGTLRTEGTFAGADGAEALVAIDFEAIGVDLARFADVVPAAAAAAGSATALGRVEIPVSAPGTFRVAADWQIEDVTWREVAIGAGAGRVEASRERVDLTDIDVGQGESRITGWARVSPARRALSAKLTARRWPVVLPADAVAYVDADIDAGIDLATRRSHGTVQGSMDVLRAGTHFAAVDVEATLTGGTVEVSTLTARLWDGTVDGFVVVPIDDWTAARGEITWSGLRLADMGADVPGRVAGRVVVAPAPGPRPLEPLLIRGGFEPDGVRLGITEVGIAEFALYLGPQRAILHRSTVAFAGGTIEGWARGTWRDGHPFVFLDARLQGLEAAGLAGVLNETPVEMPGRVDGTVSGGGPLDDVDRLFGAATLTIADSDLLGVEMVSALYDVLNLRIGRREPEGRGRAELRLEGRALDVRSVEYFNHGTDIVARLRVEDVWKGAASPITGTALGAVRPLKDFELPILRNIDRGMRAIQTNTGGVRLHGTLGAPIITSVPVPELAAALRAALGQ